MKKNPIRAVKDLRNVKYRAAAGEPLRDINPSRLKRAAHYLGRRSFDAVQRSQAEYYGEWAVAMEKASERAVGPNKQALQILLAANGIPHQHDNVLSGSGTMRGPVNSSAYVGDKRPFQVWTNQFGYGVSRDNTRHHTPLSSPLGTFHLDSTELAHNGLTIPVDNLSITAEVPVNDDDTYGEAATVMHLNTRPYDPNEPLGKSNDFSGGVRLDIAPDGTLIKVGSTHDDRRGYWDVNPATVTTNLSEFLGGVQRAVEQTAEAYTQLPR